MSAHMIPPFALNRKSISEWLGDTDYKQLRYATTVHRYPNGDIAIRHHNTDIIVYSPDDGNEYLILDNGGYESSTTKQRLCDFSPIWVIQEKHKWYAVPNGSHKDKIPFYNGMMFSFNEDGTVSPYN